MKTKIRLFALLLVVLGLSGCSLAQPERGGDEGGVNADGDPFVGFCLVYDEAGRYPLQDNPNLTEYGEETLDLGELGSHAFPREVLFAGESGRFPGLEGYTLYCLETKEEYGSCTTMVSDMSEGDNKVNDTDGNVSTELSGVVYMGPPADAGPDWDIYESAGGVWTALRVYQAPDGRAYLDGSGDSFNGVGVGFSKSATQSVIKDGETKSRSLKVSVQVKEAPRLESVTVLQYGADGALLTRTGVPLDAVPAAGETSGPAAAWEADAAWAVVEETSPSGTRRTAYDRPEEGEEPVSHTLILLDERGLGHTATLKIE